MPSKPLILLGLAALLLAAGTAQADTVDPSTAPIAFEEEAEGEEESEEGSAEEECEEAGEEFEEGEISQEELQEACQRQRQRSKPGPGGVLPEECVVRTFSSSAIASPAHNRLELTIHYTTFEPTAVTIDYGLGAAKRHLGEQGVIHLDKHLAAAQTEKLHRLAVKIGVPEAPSRCKRYYSSPARVHQR